MPFLNIPLKSIEALLTSAVGVESMPWFNPTLFPVAPGDPIPAPIDRDYRWRVTLQINSQSHSSYITRDPGDYNGQDITVGQWIGNMTTGQAWQIITIESKSTSQVVAVVQDIYRYNTFRDSSKTGNGTPTNGLYVIFNIGDTGLPQIDPIPPSGISSQFTQNLQSRFEYINLQFDFPLYQEGNTFVLNDVIAVDSNTNNFVLADAEHKVVIGRVTSVSDTIPGWFTINPVQKIVDFLDFLPGDIGDIIYSSTTVPGGITADPGGSQLYIKLRNNTSSITTSTGIGPTTPGNVIQVNGVDVTVGGLGDSSNLAAAVNAVSNQTGVGATTVLAPTTVETDVSLITNLYGEPALFAAFNPAVATINGVTVTFDITSTDPGYEDYARPAQMAQVINNANIPNIVASTPSALTLKITNTAGGPITIVNVTADNDGVPVAGSNSGTGLQLSTAASTANLVQLTAVDSRAINLLDVIGSTLTDFGLVSVENGVKACGMYIEGGLRTASSTVVADLQQLNALSPMVGDQAFVIDSNDGNGNNVGEWSTWIYDGAFWVETANQDSAGTDAKSLELTVTPASASYIEIGKISTGRRVTLITVEVITPFNAAATMTIGYEINNPSPPPPEPAGLMAAGLIDLTVAGTYTTQTNLIFGIDTPEGDVTIVADLLDPGATDGQAQIIVSYV